jgi:hypothetical protein
MNGKPIAIKDIEINIGVERWYGDAIEELCGKHAVELLFF